MKKTLVMSLLFTVFLLIVTVISGTMYNHQNNDQTVNKIKKNTTSTTASTTPTYCTTN
ncbi:hypothetical protein [Photobacterium iliopiscarium]|uniref:hypothetical protein n=1 Tax=Photobacterium iliopiscarium TaxID=56192 RepID=UPI000AE61DA4|nr:hypothetical protein [Photobacterium iliopiscarium]